MCQPQKGPRTIGVNVSASNHHAAADWPDCAVVRWGNAFCEDFRSALMPQKMYRINSNERTIQPCPWPQERRWGDRRMVQDCGREVFLADHKSSVIYAQSPATWANRLRRNPVADWLYLSQKRDASGGRARRHYPLSSWRFRKTAADRAGVPPRVPKPAAVASHHHKRICGAGPKGWISHLVECIPH